jgi:hypothetical protein
MATLITVAEAAQMSTFSHEHLAYLARKKKIAARKAGGVWLIELESLQEYERKMEELGPQKHHPSRTESA